MQHESHVPSKGLKNPELPEIREKLHDLTFTEVLIYFQNTKNFYAQFLSEIAKYSDEKIDTMCVSVENSRYVMRYHPEWYQYLPGNEVIVVIEHECLHILLHHIPRGIALLESIPDPVEKARYRCILNAAMDLAVNSLLKAHRGNQMPACALLPEQFGLPPKKSFEWYAERLAKKVKVIEIQLEVEGEGEGEGEGQGQGEGEGEGKESAQQGQGQGEGEGKEGQQGSGGQGKKSQGEGGGSKPDGRVKVKVSSGNKDLDQLLNGEDHFRIKKDPDQSTRDMLDELEKNTDKTAKEVVDLMDKLEPSRRCGSIPGWMREHINQMFAVSPVKWESILRNLVWDWKNNSKEYRINALNYSRVTMGSQVGLFGAEEDVALFQILAGIDTSGSMGSEQIAYILSVLQSFTKMESDILVKIVEYDCSIQKRYLLRKTGKVDVNVLGRGGTDFDPFFKEAKLGVDANGDRFKPDIILNFTDGYASPPRNDFRVAQIPVVWCLTKQGQHPCPEYGKQVRMEA